MKRVSILLALAMVFVLAVAAVAAGNRAGAPARGEGFGAAKQLGLSQDQAKQIAGIVRQYRTDVKGVVDSGATKEQKQTQIKALHEKAAAAIGAVLTPEQLQKAQQMGIIQRILSPQAERAMRIMMMIRQLDLTDQQKASVKTIMEDTRTQGKAINDDTSLSNDARKAKLQELHKTTVEKIRALLTPDQLKKLDELMSKGPQRRGQAPK